MDRLHRSRKNKVIFGVCGGLSEYLHIDVTLVRIICILITFMGAGIVLYLVAALIMPEDKGYTPDESQWGTGTGYGSTRAGGTGSTAGRDPNADFVNEFNSDADDWNRPVKYNSEKNRFVFGAILVGLGILILGKQFMPVLFDLRYMVPLLLIIIGGIIVYRGRK